MISNYLPIFPPDLLVATLGFSIGYYLAKGGKTFDYDIQQSEWFLNLSAIQKWLVKRFLDVTHHFYYGLVMMYIAQVYLTEMWQLFIYAMGLAILIDDINDIPRRFRRLYVTR